MIKKYSQLTLNIAIRLICSVIIGVLLLTLAYSIPIEPIERNVEKSAHAISGEGTYPKLYSWCTSQLDNWTDSIMLLEAAYDSPDNAIRDAMNATHSEIVTVTEYNGEKVEEADPYKSLISHYVNGEDFTQVVNYARYWHGYQIFLKPLLTIMDYSAIRILNSIVQILLIAVLLVLLYKKGMKGYILPFLISYGFLMPIAVFKSLQFSTCFYIIIIGAIILTLIKDTVYQSKYLYVFLYLGIAVAYFDFLTYPIATYCVCALFLISGKDFKSVKDSFFELFKTIICWGIGYAGMWASKWVVGSIITGKNVLSNALSSAKGRSYLSNSLGSFGDDLSAMLEYIFDCFFNTPVKYAFWAFLAVMIVLVTVMCIKSKLSYKTVLAILAVYSAVALLPVVWYIGLMQHSYWHFWFTNKALIAMVCAVMFMPVSLYRQAKAAQLN